MRTSEHLGLALVVVMSAALLPQAAAAGAASVTVSDLRCEYRRDPMAIDTPAPRLSWRLAAVDPAARGQRQTAYHLQVAASPTALDRGTADRWDSGPVTSTNSHLVAYAGKALRAGDACLWRVRVADERGRWSAWSPAAAWSMGPMSDADWTTRRIATDATAFVPLKPDATLRLDGQPLRVTRPDPGPSPTRIPVRLEPGRHLIEVR